MFAWYPQPHEAETVGGLAELAFAALDAGDTQQALDLLIEAIPPARRSRDEIRRVVVGILDELGLDDPLAAGSRRKLASALY